MIGYSGLAWRILWRGQNALAPVQNPEGRFHHAGQPAVYTSLTEAGCATAIARYLAPNDGPREIACLQINAERIFDLRHEPAARMVWQDLRATGAPSPTWAFSDAARAEAAQGMLYASRSHPHLTHLVLFDPQVILRETLRKTWP
jgi:RES domain-containing protein